MSLTFQCYLGFIWRVLIGHFPDGTLMFAHIGRGQDWTMTSAPIPTTSKTMKHRCNVTPMDKKCHTDTAVQRHSNVFVLFEIHQWIYTHRMTAIGLHSSLAHPIRFAPVMWSQYLVTHVHNIVVLHKQYISHKCSYFPFHVIPLEISVPLNVSKNLPKLTKKWIFWT